MTDIAQWAGCATGLAGSVLLAANSRWSKWGWLVYLVSNGCWLLFGWATHAPGLIVMQLGFFASSLFGAWRWILGPIRARARG